MSTLECGVRSETKREFQGRATDLLFARIATIFLAVHRKLDLEKCQIKTGAHREISLVDTKSQIEELEKRHFSTEVQTRPERARPPRDHRVDK